MVIIVITISMLFTTVTQRHALVRVDINIFLLISKAIALLSFKTKFRNKKINKLGKSIIIISYLPYNSLTKMISLVAEQRTSQSSQYATLKLYKNNNKSNYNNNKFSVPHLIFTQVQYTHTSRRFYK